MAELARFEITGELVAVEFTLRNAREERIPQWICPSDKTPRVESKREAKQAKLIDQATGESWEPFLYGGSLCEWCGYWERDQSLGAWMTFRGPDPDKKSLHQNATSTCSSTRLPPTCWTPGWTSALSRTGLAMLRLKHGHLRPTHEPEAL